MDGEDRVKTRSQWGYFWPSPIRGGEQWVMSSPMGLPYWERPVRGILVELFGAHSAGRGAVAEE